MLTVRNINEYTTIISQLIEQAERVQAVSKGHFKLTGEGEGRYYFDGRKLSLDPIGSFLIAHAIRHHLLDLDIEGLAGPTLGADPIIAATSLLCYLIDGRKLNGYLIRKEPKTHGLATWWEGPKSNPGKAVAVIDDTCTTGGSLFHTIELVEKRMGLQVAKILTVLERHERGGAKLQQAGYDFTSLLQADNEGNISPS